MKYVIVKDKGTVRYFFNGFGFGNGLRTQWCDPSLESGIVRFVAYPTMEDVAEVMNNIPAVERNGAVTYELDLIAPK